MFEDEPKEVGKWEKAVSSDFKDSKGILDYRPFNGQAPSPLVTMLTIFPPVGTLMAFMLKIPAMLFIGPAFLVSAWSLMRNDADKQQLLTSAMCIGMTCVSQYMQLSASKSQSNRGAALDTA